MPATPPTKPSRICCNLCKCGVGNGYEGEERGEEDMDGTSEDESKLTEERNLAIDHIPDPMWKRTLWGSDGKMMRINTQP